MPGKIQFDVELGLQSALAQVENLRKILQQSVKPDTSVYKEIDRMLTTVAAKAEKFGLTLEQSLNTPTKTKNFTSQLQATFNLLARAKDKLAAVDNNNLLISEADNARIKSVDDKIQNLIKDLEILKKGKIGNIFDNDVFKGNEIFDEIRESAKALGKDLNEISFDELTNFLVKQLEEVETALQNTQQQIIELQKVTQNTKFANVNDIKSNITQQMANNVNQAFKADNLTEANRRLQEFYNTFSEYSGKAKSKITEGSSVAKVIDTESKEINRVLSERIASIEVQRNKLQQAYDALNTIKVGSSNKKADNLNILNEQQDVLKDLGLNMKAGQNVFSFAAEARKTILAEIQKVSINAEDFSHLREQMLNGIKSVFDGLDTNQIINNAPDLKEKLTEWLNLEGINVKDGGIAGVLKEIKNNADATQVLEHLIQIIEQYVKTARELETNLHLDVDAKENQVEDYSLQVASMEDAVKLHEEEIQKKEESKEKSTELLHTEEERAKQNTHNNIVDGLNKENNAYDGLIQKLGQYNVELEKSTQRAQNISNIRQAIANWMGFNQVMNLVKNAVTEAINHIKQLDTTMNGIAIVTDMTTADLWKQVDAYSEMASSFGVTIQGAYEVSKIYYQAGYDTNEVLTLTNETLKLSKISGLDYATTTDYMMTAMRGFKMEMEDASRVVDVYSNLAANTAVSQQELAEAMTRTASSMESVGATFEETSAMIATMVAVTRESASNIGSAMKSIASRYGELTKDPTALFDAEGEAMSFNKVDEALRSVGITLQTTDHQFRNFTDVIMELAEVWDQLDSAQQRYIATQFAGNRQQSRFLALVSNKDLLKENLVNAQNSEDVGTLQALKALDSIESKLNQVQVAYQQFYTTMGIESVWKGLLDGATSVLETLNKLPKAFDTIPVSALAMATSVISFIKNVLFVGLQRLINSLVSKLDSYKAQFQQTGYNIGQAIGKGIKEGVDGATKNLPQVINNNAAGKGQLNATNQGKSSWLQSSAPAAIGAGLVTAGALINTDSREGERVSGLLTGVGGIFQILSGGVRALSGDLSGLITLFQGLGNVIGGVGLFIETAEERQARLVREAETLSNTAKQEKANYNQLAQAVQKYEELRDKQFESAEAAEEYQQAVNALAEIAPELVISFDAAGNAIIEAENAEELLAQARQKSAQATLNAAEADLKAKSDALNTANENLQNFNPREYKLETATNGNDIYTEVREQWSQKLTDLSEQADENNENAASVINKIISDIDGKLQQDLAPDTETFLNIIANEVNSIIDNLPEQSGIGRNNRQNYSETPYWKDIQSWVQEAQKKYISQPLSRKESRKQQAIEDRINNFPTLPTLDDVLDFESYLTTATADSENLKKDYQDLFNYLTQTKELIQAGIDAKTALDVSAKSYAAAFQSNETLQGSPYQYITENSGFVTLLNKSFSDSVTTFEDATNSKAQMKWRSNMKMVEDFWTGLSDTKKEMFNQMFSDTASFGPSDILQLLDFSGPDTDSDETITQYLDSIKNDGTIEAFIANWYLDRIRQIQTRVQQQLESSGIRLDNIKIDAIETEDQANYISTIISRIQQLQNAGFVNTANNFQDAAEQLYTDIMKLGPELRNTVFDIIKKYGFDTVEDIKNITADLANVEGLDKNFGADELKTISGTMFQNMNLTLQGAFSDFMQSWDNASKELTQAISGGFNFKEADAFITRARTMGMEDFGIDDFIINAEGKMVLTADAYQSFYQALSAKQEEIASNAQASVSAAKGNLALLKTQSASGNESVLYAIRKGVITEDQARSLGITDLTMSIDDALVAAEEYVTANAESADEIAESWRLASEQLSKTTLKTSLTQFLSDVLSKPLGDIKINNDYPALEKATRDNLQSLISSDNFSYADFIKSFASEYKDKLNLTIQEVNNYYIQALEKDRAQTTGAAKQALDDVTVDLNGIAYASADTIKQLADAFNLDVSTLIGEYSSSMDAYAFNIKEFGRERIAEIEGGQAALQDAVSEYFKSLVDLFSNGIKGSLSYSDVNKLASELSKYNVQLNELDFTPTANGLKLSEDAAIRIYSALKDIDGIRAQLLFDDMKESLSESGEACENISTTLASIADLERQLQSPANANNKILQDRLAIYKEIAVAQTSDPNQYKFMDRNMPAPMQGPLNYWDSVGKAYTAMNESAASGYMDVQDFYNIVNEMSSLASISGQNLEFMGQTISGSAEDAAALIERGMSALSNIDGKGVKIDLSKLGVDISSGAESMQKGFDNGVKAMAKSQIEMLDAAIQMLEAVVAMEELGNIDVNGNGELDIDDLFIDFKTSGKMTEEATIAIQHIQEAATTNEDLKNALESIEIDGFTLAEIFDDAADGTLDATISAQQFFAVVKAFNQAAKDGNYDLEQLLPSVQKILGATLPEDLTWGSKDGKKVWTILNGQMFEVNFEEPNTKALLEEVQTKYNLTEEDAKTKVKDLIKTFSTNNTKDLDNEEFVLTGKMLGIIGETTIEITDENGEKKTETRYTYNGRVAKTPEEIRKIIAEDQMRNAGFSAKNTEAITDANGEQIGVRAKVNVGSAEIVVESTGSGVSYNYKNTTYSSAEAVRNAILKDEGDELLSSEHLTADSDQYQTWYAKRYAELNTQFNITENKITVGGNNSVSSIEQFLNTSDEEVQKKIDEAVANHTGDEPFKVTFDNGLEFEFTDKNTTAADLKNNPSIQNKINSLVQNIAEGIKTAFTANEGKNEISEALATGIRDALTTKSVDVGESGAAPTVNVSELKVTAEKLTLNETEEGKKVPIDTLDATVTTLNVSTDDTTTPNYEGVSLPAQTEENKPTLDDVVEAYVKFLNLSLGTDYDITDTGVTLPTGYTLTKKDFVAQATVALIDLIGTPGKGSESGIDLSNLLNQPLTTQIATMFATLLMLRPTGVPEKGDDTLVGLNKLTDKQLSTAISAMTAVVTYVNPTGTPTKGSDETGLTLPEDVVLEQRLAQVKAYVDTILAVGQDIPITKDVALTVAALTLANVDANVSGVTANGTEVPVTAGGITYGHISIDTVKGWLSQIKAYTQGSGTTAVIDDGLSLGELDISDQEIIAKLTSLSLQWAQGVSAATGIQLPDIPAGTSVEDTLALLTAFVSQVDVQWANGQNFDTQSLFTTNSDGTIDLGTKTGVVTIDEVIYNSGNSGAIKAEQLSKRLNSKPDFSTSFNEIDYYNDDLEYAEKLLTKVRENGETLSNIDLNNLNILKDLYTDKGGWFSGDVAKSGAEELVSTLQKIEEVNGENLANNAAQLTAIFEALGQSDAAQIAALATAMTELTTSLETLSSMEWPNLVEGLDVSEITFNPSVVKIGGTPKVEAGSGINMSGDNEQGFKMDNIDIAHADINELKIDKVGNTELETTAELTLVSATAKVTDLTVSATNLVPDAGVKELQGMDFSGTTSGLSTIAGKLSAINGATFSNFDTLSGKLATIQGQLDTIVATINQLTDKEINVNLHTTGNNGGSNNGGTTTSTSGGSTSAPTVDFTDMLASLSNAVGVFGDAIATVQGDLNSLSTDRVSSAIDTLSTSIGGIPVNGLASLAINNIALAMGRIPDVGNRVSALARAMNNIPSGTQKLNVRFDYTTKAVAAGNIGTMATGNAAMAGGTRRTLMGELGPELVVSNGRYFVVGQGGAEFVDLAEDAIVFNHLQTRRLIEQGAISSRGKPFTNEINAVSYAKGNNPLFGFAHDKEHLVIDDPTGGDVIPYEKPTTTTTVTKTEKINSVKPYPTYHSFQLYSFAKGNMAGPAMASAKAALAALKEIRAMWQALLDSSPKNLGALAGRGGGGKGGGGGGKGGSGDGGDSGGEGEETTPFQLTAATAEIQRWYNLLRQIERLEKDITYQEQLQNNLLADQADNGELIYQSYKKELDFLDEEIVKQKQLLELQKSWLEARIADLTNPETSVLARIFTYDPEKRLLQYRGDGTPGSGVGLDILEQLNRRDINGQGLDHAANSEEQLKYLDDLGVDLSMLTYKDDGTRIAEFDATGKLMDAATHEWLEGEELDSARTEMVERFFELVESEMDEIDSLQESIEDTQKSILEEEAKANEILQKLIDNQLEIEQSVLKAITDREQSVIDALEDEKDAINDAANKFVDGLSEQLNREREMYNQNNQNEELIRLQRQLVILQRAGGSAAQIKSLQDQITAKQRDAYFDAQQNQIDAIKDASDKEIERLDAQLNIMTETLEYQKEHGLLWSEVYSVMNDSKNAILNFISTFDEAFKPISALDLDQKLIELGDKIGQWIAYRDDTNTAINNNKPTLIAHNATQGWDTFIAAYSDAYSDIWNQEYSNIKAVYEDELAKTGDTNAADAAALKYLWDKTGRALPLIDAGGSSLPVQKTTYSSVTGHAKPKETSSSGGGEGGGDPWDGIDEVDNTLTTYGYTEFTTTKIGTPTNLTESNSVYKRKEPSATSEKMGKVSNGTTVELVGQTDNGWYKTADGYYVSADFIKIVSTSTDSSYVPPSDTPTTTGSISFDSTDTLKKISAESGQNIRKEKSASSSLVGFLSKGTPVALIRSESDNWKYIKFIKDNQFVYGYMQGSLSAYKRGGLIDFTGPAWVDGSKTRPEGILNADETEFFRNDFMHSAHLLTSVMHDLDILVDDMSDTSRYNGIGSTESINIENAQVIMNVDSIASDYDAQRAGEQALEQMLKIARKSGTLSLTRR